MFRRWVKPKLPPCYNYTSPSDSILLLSWPRISSLLAITLNSNRGDLLLLCIWWRTPSSTHWLLRIILSFKACNPSYLSWNLSTIKFYPLRVISSRYVYCYLRLGWSFLKHSWFGYQIAEIYWCNDYNGSYLWSGLVDGGCIERIKSDRLDRLIREILRERGHNELI